MERKKVLALKENQVLEINQNLIVRTDHKDHQEMERKKVLALKKNQVLQKKIIQNHLALQIIQNILEENLQKIYLQTQRKKALVLRERKNLKVEIADLKALALKNIVKKELNLKIF
jgi:hypothetical protein